MIKTYQYRIYPTHKQKKHFETCLEASRNLYNQALAWRKDAYEQRGESVSCFDQSKALTQLRKESAFWSSLHFDMLADVLRRLDKAYTAFFRRAKAGEKAGFPRFKGRGRYRSVTFRRPSKRLIQQIGGRSARLTVPKLGQVKIRYHRPLPEGEAKTLTIHRKASGWYANIAIETGDVPKVDIRTAVGIDVGLNHFLTTSDGETVGNPRHLRVSELKLKKKQRRVSRRKKGSGRRKQAVSELARLHERISSQRKDFHFNTAHTLFSRYDAVVVEDLQIKNMVKNHHLAKSISDAAWGNFRLILESKAENAGKHLLKVNPYGTSQTCSDCGQTVKKTLATRIHRCDCGCVLDRDHNAAINILRAAHAPRGGALVVDSPETLLKWKEPKLKKLRKVDESIFYQLTLFEDVPQRKPETRITRLSTRRRKSSIPVKSLQLSLFGDGSVTVGNVGNR